MKTVPLILLSAVLCLPACAPKRPEIPLTEVPAGELVKALEERRQSFSSLKAMAGVQAVRKGRKRSIDTVAVLLDSRSRLRMEAYSPLGQSMLTLVCDGKEVLLRKAGEDRVITAGEFGLERLLGVSVEVRELSAALSGNIPEITQSFDARAFCGQDNECAVEFSQGETVRRVWVAHSVSGPEPRFTITSYELYRSESLVFRARFERIEDVSGYYLPMKVKIENPDRKMSLTVEYNDVEVNAPLDDAAFTLTEEVGTAP